MKNRFYMWVAYKLPKNIVYWAAMRVLANATSGKYSNEGVPGVTAIDAIQRWS